MGGQIEVESQLEQGTTFRVCLPLASPHHWQIRHHKIY
ncbi:hypothetical protein H6F88_32075 [Oculatella sp. FACHB-28]|nr:hypothetical protein [Oculatella sp. FACHB-28]